MGNNIVFDKHNDRIVEINGFELINCDNYKPNRRNVICYSDILQLYITSNKLPNDYVERNTIISDLINKNILIDIKVIKVKGYY